MSVSADARSSDAYRLVTSRQVEPQVIALPSGSASCRPKRLSLLKHLGLLEIGGQVIDGMG